MSDGPRQPALHELVTCLASPTTVLSARDGQMRGCGAHGAYVADVRVLSRAVLTVDGLEPEPVGSAAVGPGGAEFLAVLRSLGDDVPDPTVWVRRRRTARPSGCAESITVVNVTAAEIRATVELALAGDMAEIETVKVGSHGEPAAFHPDGDGFVVRSARLTAHVTAGGAESDVTADGGRLRWSLTVPPRGRAGVTWSVKVEDPDAVVVPTRVPSPFVPPRVTADDRRLGPLVTRAVEDLAALRMCTSDRPGDEFLAAGSPWYLTLFGRDSIWAARMLLPLGTESARGTLATLAAWQGTTLDSRTAEEPGKILHELRRGEFSFGATSLPPVYYGTVDATPLWVCLLADAWRWGLDEATVASMLPAVEGALAWMVDYGDADGDGFLEYVDRSGRGLANQGWKDSGDSLRFADGRIASGPVALAEVQGYAHEAALAGADLLSAFGRPGADRWRDYAAELAREFRERFWVADDLGAYPAMALDGRKVPVDAPASNMGHLLASGMLSVDESRAIADRLVHPTMSSGFGLRTMSSAAGGYSPLSYHCGSVWPHDTAIAIHGLIRGGFTAQAAVLAEGLLAAGTAFQGRVPELYGGFDRSDVAVPVPYPAACRPQAWSAAAAVAILQAFLGVQADVPRGTVRVEPSARMGAMSVTGLRVAGRELRISVSGDGTASAEVDGDGLRVDIGPSPKPPSNSG